MTEIEFSTNLEAAAKIADRAPTHLVDRSGGRMSFIMDILAADGVNGNDPINLDALAGADDMNFAHDVAGIVRHIDRSTGKLTDCFVPRYARHRLLTSSTGPVRPGATDQAE
jgi:hypothetical protein